MKKRSIVAVALLVVLFVAYATWLRSPAAAERFTPPQDDSAATIFISIASYRDVDCLNTLKSIFGAASHPARVFVGVCEQNSSAAAELCLPSQFQWHDQVRRISVPAREAKGPTYARYLCSTLYRGETFFCQLDSHMRFVQGWDATAIDMVRACPSKKAIITHYPHDYDQAQTGINEVPVLCKAAFDAQGLVTFDSDTLPPGTTPKPVPFTAGGFMFGPGSLVREVPYDPDLPHLFQGEELLYSARLWTSGYDFYTPLKNIVFHHYYRKDAPKFWNDLDYSTQQQDTVSKVKRVLGGGMKDYAYGMGTARTLNQYWDFAGINWSSKTTTTAAKFCR